MQAGLIAVALSGALLTAAAHLADKRRLRRTTPDRVGFMPWPALSMIGIAMALVGTALAILAG